MKKKTLLTFILKKRLTNMRMKDNDTMIDYLDKFRMACGDLELIGSPMVEDHLIITLLNSLPPT